MIAMHDDTDNYSIHRVYPISIDILYKCGAPKRYVCWYWYNEEPPVTKPINYSYSFQKGIDPKSIRYTYIPDINPDGIYVYIYIYDNDISTWY